MKVILASFGALHCLISASISRKIKNIWLRGYIHVGLHMGPINLCCHISPFMLCPMPYYFVISYFINISHPAPLFTKIIIISQLEIQARCFKYLLCYLFNWCNEIPMFSNLKSLELQTVGVSFHTYSVHVYVK